ncbi:MAG: ABC transporter substrate-binding protein [Promethearchaeota archaeon]|jgi:peptide/nickel transport system substrate-binding protein
MEMEKKNLAIIILAVVLAASGIGNIILAITGGGIQLAPEDKDVLKVVRGANPVTFDPIDSWDSVSNDVIVQVAEPLITFDYVDMQLKPTLALNWSWPSLTEIRFTLRQNVYFHDGALFNATAVKHTFDRLNYFGNTSGTLPASKLEAHPSTLYKINSTTPLIKNVTIWSEYECSIFLNGPFAPFEGLLAYAASCIVHPDSAPAEEYVNLASDMLIGTGPFKMVNYEPNLEVRFERWERYWQTGAFWDEIVYIYYADSITANNAMLALDVDYLGGGMASLKQTFIDDPNIEVVEVGTATIYWYFGLNNHALNITWRKTIAQGFNYSFFLDDIEEGTGIRGRNLVPPGFPGRNDSVYGYDFDIEAARLLMQSMGFGVGWETGTMVDNETFTAGADEASWLAADFRPAQLAGDQIKFRQMVGIQLEEQSVTWTEYIEGGKLDPDFMNIYFAGWGPDYFETFNMIDPLVNPDSSANYAQVDEAEVTATLALARAETDELARYALYELLQYLVIEKYVLQMPLEYNLLYIVHAKSLKGFPYNINRDVIWYPTYRA